MIAFDETELNPRISYNKKFDMVEGFVDLGHLGREPKEATKVLVFVLRGLGSVRWKQTVSFYFTDSHLESQKLRDIVLLNIRKVLAIGFNLLGVASDGDGKNRKLSRDLGCTTERPFFKLDEKELVYLFDTPHILKNIRNALMIRDIYVEVPHTYLSINGRITTTLKGIVSWKTIDRALRPTVMNRSTFMNEIPKITLSHLDPKGYNKMKVKLVAQLFSSSVAAHLIQMVSLDESLTNEDKENIKRAALFIKFLDQLFDILNSHTEKPRNSKLWARALTDQDDDQIRFLEDSKTVIKSMIFKQSAKGSKSPVYSRYMLLQTINGILHLRRTIPSSELKYLFTRRLGTDSVENYFAQVKSRCKCLSSMNFQSFYHASLILRSLQQEKTNCEEDQDETLLDSDALNDFENDSFLDSSDGETALARFFNSFDPYNETVETALQIFFSEYNPLSHPDSYSDNTARKHSFAGYFAGYLLRRIKEDSLRCENCIQKLESSHRLDFHLLTQIREYDLEKERLLYVSQEFFDLVEKIISELMAKIPNMIFTVGLKTSLYRIFNYMDFNFLPDCHRSELRNIVLRHSINSAVNQYLRIIIESQKKKDKEKSFNLKNVPPSSKEQANKE